MRIDTPFYADQPLDPGSVYPGAERDFRKRMREENRDAPAREPEKALWMGVSSSSFLIRNELSLKTTPQ